MAISDYIVMGTNQYTSSKFVSGNGFTKTDSGWGVAVNTPKGKIYEDGYDGNGLLIVRDLANPATVLTMLRAQNYSTYGHNAFGVDEKANLLFTLSINTGDLWYWNLDANGMPIGSPTLLSARTVNGVNIKNAATALGTFRDSLVILLNNILYFVDGTTLRDNTAVTAKKVVTLTGTLPNLTSSHTIGITGNALILNPTGGNWTNPLYIYDLNTGAYQGTATVPGNHNTMAIAFSGNGDRMFTVEAINDFFYSDSVTVKPYSNNAPNTPVINNPKGSIDAPKVLTSLTPLLDWSFSDPDPGDTQKNFIVRIKKASDSSVVHSSGAVVSAVTDYQVPAGVLQANVIYYWEVMTDDQTGAGSAFSSAEFFKVVPGASLDDVYNFGYTGAEQTFTVPGNVTKLKIEAYGASGGTSATHGGTPANGGYVWGAYDVTPGETLSVYVGGRGGQGGNSYNAPGGWNGGGQGGYNDGGGGGGTDVRKGGKALSNRIIVAGGGGGFEDSTSSTIGGGIGGGLEGGSGAKSIGQGSVIPTGGTQRAGGINSTDTAKNGALGQGGIVPTGNDGGGGGGGYYGGAAGDVYSAGGGGSSYYGNGEKSGTTAGGNTLTLDGSVKITVVTANSDSVSFTSRSPGKNDQLNPEGSTPAPLFTWGYSDPTFIQSKYQIKMYEGGTLVHDTGLIVSTSKQHQISAGILTPGKTYGWELTAQNAAGISIPSNRIYFITNRPPGALVPINPADRYRTGLRPTFIATIGDDVEDNPQKFVIQIAKDAGFTKGLLERISGDDVDGWAAKTVAGTYEPVPAAGVDSSFEGGTAKYTWNENLEEGKTYFWRMAGIDGSTGSRGAWSEVRSIRVGNRIDVTLKKPVVTSAAIQRLLVRASYNLATDGVIPATAVCEATNNALDEEPTWEDVTPAVISGEYHEFKNDVKTAVDWAFNIRMTFQANDSLDPIEFYGFGVSFD